MMKGLPPLPWHCEPELTGFINIVDADGRRIATVWGDVMGKHAVAELIIEASKASDPSRRSGMGLFP